MRGWLVVLLLLCAADAQACNRCGIFGRGCRYGYVYQQPVVAAVQYQQPSILVVQNSYPQPNGAVGLLAQQGGTSYGYQAAAAAYFVNPAEVLRQSAELSKAATATAQLGLTGYAQTAQTQLGLQAAIAEPLIRGQAAAQVLTAAGLNHSATAQVQRSSIKLTPQADGTWTLTQEQSATEVTQQPGQPVRSHTLVGQHCASCHGAGLAEPKGGLVFDMQALDCSLALRAYRAVMSGKMPQGTVLDEQTKMQLGKELIDLAQTE